MMSKKQVKKAVAATTALPRTVERPIALGALTPEFEDLFQARRIGYGRSLLVIQTRQTRMDPIAKAALVKTREHFAVDEDQALKLIQEKGLATEISKVTKRLNQMRLSDVRRQVLAATYIHTLSHLLEEGKVDPQDTLGFTDAVLFFQEQDQPAGDDMVLPAPATKFAQEVVRLVLDENRVALEDLEIELLVNDLRRADISLKPGRVKPAVMTRVEKIVKQGTMPALVEKFIKRGEIESGKFTTPIKEAMVEYLLDRGVQVTDLEVFDKGGYDAQFVVAYEHAISRATGKQDPIDVARLDGRGRPPATWDLTLDYFDDVEAQGIIRDNILASGAIDYIYELGERLGVFRLADVLVLNWASGAIDVADGEAARRLYRYWKLREERSSAEERAMLYKRVLNKADAKVLSRMVVNEHFPGLWHNLMAEVAKYIEKSERIEEGASETSPVSRSAIYQATKELQYNLTEFCTGMAHMQARELYAQLQEAFDILRNPEIIAHFGGSRRKTLWTVIGQLSKTELGVAPNTAAIRTLAVAGNQVFNWIANFDEATVTHEQFLTFMEAAESYILNMAVVGSDLETVIADGDEDDWDDDDWDDDWDEDSDDDFGDF